MSYLNTRLKDIPNSNDYIQHFGIPGMKWGWSKDGRKTGAKEAMTEDERKARLYRLRDAYNKMKIRESKIRQRVNGLYSKDPAHRIVNRVTFGFKNIGDSIGTLSDHYNYSKARKALGIKKGENVNKYLKELKGFKKKKIKV